MKTDRKFLLLQTYNWPISPYIVNLSLGCGIFQKGFKFVFFIATFYYLL